MRASCRAGSPTWSGARDPRGGWARIDLGVAIKLGNSEST